METNLNNKHNLNKRHDMYLFYFVGLVRGQGDNIQLKYFCYDRTHPFTGLKYLLRLYELNLTKTSSNHFLSSVNKKLNFERNSFYKQEKEYILQC